MYERLMYSQMLPFIRPKLSNLLCGFMGGYSSQHALLRLVETCKQCLDCNGVVGMVLTDLSKAYDCLPYDLLVATLHAYSFGLSCLKMLYSYLTSRKQRVKTNSTYSSWLDVKLGVKQGSALGPLFFIFITDIFRTIEASEICNFADDNTIYALSHNAESMIAKLEIDIYNTLKRFDANSMVANPSKISGNVSWSLKESKLALKINGDVLANSKEVKLLGVAIDSQLNFKTHVKALCVKANRKVSEFARVAKYIDFQKAKLLYESFAASMFKYVQANLAKTWVLEYLDSITIRFMRKWLDLPTSATFSGIILPCNQFGLNL